MGVGAAPCAPPLQVWPAQPFRAANPTQERPLPLPLPSPQVLPLGCSKGTGVQWLLDRLGVDPAACMGLGDGENDVEMLQLLGLGVAMGNAGPPALGVADHITASNAEDGVARAVERFVLGPRGLL